MKPYLVFFLLLPLVSLSQLQDDFSDGDFTQNPSWGGDITKFVVNPSKQLQLNDTAAGSSSLTVANNLFSLANSEWRFWVRLNFAPSSSNNARIFLSSDQNNLKGSLNGYYLQFGEANANDAVELFKKNGAASSSVCRGTNSQIANAFAIGIKVTRDAGGLWSLFVDTSGGTNYVLQATGVDSDFNTSSCFGIVCNYTKTNASDFYFDTFYIPFSPDIISPNVVSATAISSAFADVKFSEAVDLTTSQVPSNYIVNNGIGSPVSAIRDLSDYSIVHLTFAIPFSEGILNTLSVVNVSDLSNNNLSSTNTASFTWHSPHPPEAGDIVINEVLFSPKTGGKEFVEIYNRSDKAIDIKDLRITKIDLNTYKPDPPVSITTISHLVLPYSYLVLSDDPLVVKNQYYTENPSAFLQVNLPSLLDDEDIIILQDQSLKTLDEFHYHSSWHFPLLNDVHGISLERVSASRPTNDSTNWHSAAEKVGATPGYRNSQHEGSMAVSNEITIEPEVFSPDSDGKDDIVNIYFHFNTSNYIANVKVFDAKGRLVRRLVENQLIGNEGAFSWDGINDKKEKARTGIYIFYIQAFDVSGNVKEFKQTCVLATRL